MNGYCYEGSDKKRDYWASHLLEQCYHRNMFVNGSASICKKEKRGLFSYPSKIPPAEANAFVSIYLKVTFNMYGIGFVAGTTVEELLPF